MTQDGESLTVTMPRGEWQALAEVLERALDVVLEQSESPRKRQSVSGLVACLKDLHDDGVFVESIDEAGSALYDAVVDAIEAFDGEN